jgi:hypothetical protein
MSVTHCAKDFPHVYECIEKLFLMIFTAHLVELMQQLQLHIHYEVEDKNNGNLNQRLMGQFHRFLNDATLKEIHLQGRLFTWSKERTHPTLERIDRVFICTEWEEL